MTDYPAKSKSLSRAGKGTKRGARRVRDLFAVLIVLVLLVVVLKGIFKDVNLGEAKSSSWDGRGPVAIFLNTKPASFVVYQKDLPKIALFSISSDISFPTGNADNPLVSIGEIKSSRSEEEEMRMVSFYLGADIQNYIYFENSPEINKQEFERMFANFASFSTPFSIFGGGLTGVSQTNLGKMDLLSLWWNVKGLTPEDLEYYDSSNYSEDIVVQDKENVKTLDRELVRRDLGKYFENQKLRNIDDKLLIQNSSGIQGVGTLASDIATLSGFDVFSVEGRDDPVGETIILAKDKNDYSALYLAKIFNCDINAWPSSAEDGNDDSKSIMLIVGQDFAEKYF